MKLKMFMICILLSVMNVVFASNRSSSIPINGLMLKPGAYGMLLLDKLYDGVTYQLLCTFKNNGNTDEPKKDVTFTTMNPKENPLSIDGAAASYGIVQQIKSSGSLIEIKHVKYNDKFIIRNFDYTDTLSLEQCIANIERP